MASADPTGAVSARTQRNNKRRQTTSMVVDSENALEQTTADLNSSRNNITTSYTLNESATTANATNTNTDNSTRALSSIATQANIPTTRWSSSGSNGHIRTKGKEIE